MRKKTLKVIINVFLMASLGLHSCQQCIVTFAGVTYIAQNAYCSRDIYFQFNKVRRSVILRAIMQRLYENASAIGCEERTIKLINMLLVAN